MAVKKSEEEIEITSDVEVEKVSKKSKKEDKAEKEPEVTDLPGVGPAVAAKLEAGGVYDLMALAVSSPAALADIAGVSPAVSRKIIQAARELLDLGFQDGTEFAKKRANCS